MNLENPKIYHISKGLNHIDGFHMGLHFKNEMKFKAKFSNRCLYDLGNSDNYDVNKLFGFSTSYHHHIQSARIGWRCIDGERIQILTYTYDQRRRQEPQLLGTVNANSIFECSIVKRKNYFEFEFIHGEKSKKY